MEGIDLEEEESLNIAVLSGKGGTGKTTVSTNIALALKASYIDCDVEEPNGFVFLKPQIDENIDVVVDYPIIDDEKCTSCGACVDICQFNALAKINRDIVLFDKLCHGCGGCEIVCEYDALTYGKREVGRIEEGMGYGIRCSRGILNIGEPIAVPVIRQLLQRASSGINIIDCPPGTSCNVVSSLRYAHSAILVTEPTKFGLHDLDRAVELVKMFDIPFGVIINKDDGTENVVKNYCESRRVNILGSIPYSSDVALAYSNGEMLYSVSDTRVVFDKLAESIEEVL